MELEIDQKNRWDTREQWNRKNPKSLSETRIEIRQRRKNYESSYFSTFPQNLDEFYVKYG